MISEYEQRRIFASPNVGKLLFPLAASEVGVLKWETRSALLKKNCNYRRG